jgi:hypothetical protein
MKTKHVLLITFFAMISALNIGFLILAFPIFLFLTFTK